VIVQVPESASFDSVVCFAAKLQLFRQQLQRYCQHADAESIHDLRTSIRRLQAAYSVVPADSRSRDSGVYLNDIRQLFRLNSKIRDSDVIKQKLSQQLPQDHPMLDELDEIRQRELKLAQQQAIELAKLPLPILSAGSSTDSRQRERKIRRRALRIIARQTLVITQPQQSEELHELRKDIKKLFYLLELGKPVLGRSRIEYLKRVQRKAGAIRDCDIILTFLSGHRIDPVTSKSLHKSERKQRNRYFADLRKALQTQRWNKLLAVMAALGCS
jgi:CHAD domain-containing protein